MQGNEISIDKMKEGDVLLFESVSGVTHLGIAAGQATVSHRMSADSNVTHAGLYDGKGSILEASGEAGLRNMGLEGKAQGSKYQVYRSNVFQIQGLPICAARWAKVLTEKRPEELKNVGNKGEGFGRYGTAKAVGALFSLSYRGRRAKAAEVALGDDPWQDRSFYCSNFVVECYVLACRDFRCKPLIKADYRKLTPKLLQAELRRNSRWEHVGNYVVTRPPK